MRATGTFDWGQLTGTFALLKTTTVWTHLFFTRSCLSDLPTASTRLCLSVFKIFICFTSWCKWDRTIQPFRGFKNLSMTIMKKWQGNWPLYLSQIIQSLSSTCELNTNHLVIFPFAHLLFLMFNKCITYT